jgi:hypothetical protein
MEVGKKACGSSDRAGFSMVLRSGCSNGMDSKRSYTFGEVIPFTIPGNIPFLNQGMTCFHN